MYSLVTGPAEEPLTLAEVKSTIRVDHTNDDALLLRMLSAARSYVETRLDRSLVLQTWECRWEREEWACINLRPSPVSQIVSVSILTCEGEGISIPQSAIRMRRFPNDRVLLDKSQILYSGNVEYVTVTFLTGESSAANIPQDLRQAVSSLTAHYYDHREAFVEGRFVAMPHGLEALLAPYQSVKL